MNRYFVAADIRLDYRKRQHRNSQTSADTTDDAFERAKFQLTEQINSSFAKEPLKTLPIGTTHPEDKDFVDLPFQQRCFQRPVLRSTYQHELFDKARNCFQIVMFDRSGNQSSVQSIFQNPLNKISGSACLHRDINVSMPRSVHLEQRGQSRRRRRFHRTETKSSMRFTILRNRVFRLL